MQMQSGEGKLAQPAEEFEEGVGRAQVELEVEAAVHLIEEER